MINYMEISIRYILFVCFMLIFINYLSVFLLLGIMLGTGY